MSTNSEFRYIMGAIELIEGGYSYVSGDSGGETYMGITRNSYNEPNIWNRIDKYKEKNGGKIKHGTIFNDKQLYQSVEEIYIKNYFNPLKISKIQDKRLGVHVFYISLGGNKGKGLFTQSFGGGSQDNAITNANKDPQAIYKFIQDIKQYYYDAAKIGNNQKFLKGWLNRVDKINNYLGITPYTDDDYAPKLNPLIDSRTSRQFFTPNEYSLYGGFC